MTHGCDSISIYIDKKAGKGGKAYIQILRKTIMHKKVKLVILFLILFIACLSANSIGSELSDRDCGDNSPRPYSFRLIEIPKNDDPYRFGFTNSGNSSILYAKIINSSKDISEALTFNFLLTNMIKKEVCIDDIIVEVHSYEPWKMPENSMPPIAIESGIKVGKPPNIYSRNSIKTLNLQEQNM
jgi:hypothetical protein